MLALLTISLLAAALPAAAVESALPGAAWQPPADRELLRSSQELQSFAVSRTFFERLTSQETSRQVRDWAQSIRSYPKDNFVRLSTLREQLIADGIDPLTLISSRPARENGRTIRHGLCVRISAEGAAGSDGVLITAPAAPGNEEVLASLFMTAHLMQDFRLQPLRPVYLCAVAGEGPGENFEGIRELVEGSNREGRAVSASSHIAMAGSGSSAWVNFLGTETLSVRLSANAMPWSSSKSSDVLKKAAEGIRETIKGTSTAWQKDRMSPRSSMTVSPVSCSGALLKEECGFTVQVSSRSRLAVSEISESVVNAAAEAAAKLSSGDSSPWRLEFIRGTPSPAIAMHDFRNASVMAWRASLGSEPPQDAFISAGFIRSGATVSAQSGLSAIVLGSGQGPKGREGTTPAALLKRTCLTALLLSGLSSGTTRVEGISGRQGKNLPAGP